MDNIVVVAVQLDTGERRYFLTWGRIQATVDPAPLEALVLRQCKRFALKGTAVSAEVCWSLQEASQETYFHEALWQFSQKKGPFGPRYKEWRKKKAKAMEIGRELSYLGLPRPAAT